jgi:two-component system, NarL family, nitrate/nitrite response regulator NarL
VTVEHVRAVQSPVRAAAPARPTQKRPPYAPSQRSAPRPGGAVCLVIPEISDGDGPTLVRNLRRRDSSHAVLLARSAGRRELVTLLGGGIRGAITTEPNAEDASGYAGAAWSGPELTDRELGVLELVASGHSNKQIGETLNLSALTIKSHLARISRKIGTGDRAEMVAHVLRHHLLT